jgi:hypothetical protein
MFWARLEWLIIHAYIAKTDVSDLIEHEGWTRFIFRMSHRNACHVYTFDMSHVEDGAGNGNQIACDATVCLRTDAREVGASG